MDNDCRNVQDSRMEGKRRIYLSVQRVGPEAESLGRQTVFEWVLSCPDWRYRLPRGRLKPRNKITVE